MENNNSTQPNEILGGFQKEFKGEIVSSHSISLGRYVGKDGAEEWWLVNENNKQIFQFKDRTTAETIMRFFVEGI